jgi:hypothetical protein
MRGEITGFRAVRERFHGRHASTAPTDVHTFPLYGPTPRVCPVPVAEAEHGRARSG